MYIDSLIILFWSSAEEPNGMVPNNGGSRNIDTKLQKTVAVNRREGNEMLRSSIFFLRFSCLWFVSMLYVSSHRPFISVCRELPNTVSCSFRHSSSCQATDAPPVEPNNVKRNKNGTLNIMRQLYHSIYSCRLYKVLEGKCSSAAIGRFCSC